MRIDEREMISATDAARCSSKLFREAAEGRRFVIFTNNAPTAAVVGMDQYRELSELHERQENLKLLTLALTRTATDSGRRHDLSDVIADLGFTDEEIDEAENFLPHSRRGRGALPHDGSHSPKVDQGGPAASSPTPGRAFLPHIDQSSLEAIEASA